MKSLLNTSFGYIYPSNYSPFETLIDINGLSQNVLIKPLIILIPTIINVVNDRLEMTCNIFGNTDFNIPNQN